MKKENSSGLTFLEALMVLALMGLVIVLSAGLFQGMAKMRQRSQKAERRLQVMAALEEMRREVWEAVTVTTPESGDSDRVEVVKINPSVVGRLPETPTVWNPRQPEHLLRVHYFMDADQLIRRTTDSAGGTVRGVVARDIEALAAERLDEGSLEIKLSMLWGNNLSTYQAKVRRYLP